VIFVNRFYHPDSSATSQLLTDVARSLADEGRDVVVVTSRHPKRDIRKPDISHLGREITVLSVRSTNIGRKSLIGRIVDYLSFYPSCFVALLRICKRGDIIVVKTDPPLILVVAGLAGWLKGAKLVNWLQDLYPEVAAALGVPLLRGPFGRMLTGIRNIFLRRARANVVIGAKMADRLIAYGVKPGRIHLLPNWSDEGSIRPLRSSASAARREWQIPDDVFVLGYSGNFGRAHESETILKAATILKDRPDICFLFVGGGHESRRLEAAIAKAGLTNFLFKEHQPKEHLSDSLGAADAHWLSLRPELEGLIVPSKFYGIVSAGRPVIAVTHKDGEIARAIRHLDCGYVVEPGDGEALAALICQLADRPDQCEKVGQRARAAADTTYARRVALKRWEFVLQRVEQSTSTKAQTKVYNHPEVEPLARYIEELEQFR
jgi:glycosyltransferase involved in cell wall biosynthesis